MDGIAYGGDYNPEQWPEPVWTEDVRLMRAAGVNLVTVGVFAWAQLEPAEGDYHFDWLDRVIDLLHGGGVRVDLATPTAAPPPWFLHRYPQAHAITRDGTRLSGGTRQSFCPSAPAYAAAASRITERLGERYGAHPAVALWHVNNEYGNGVHTCWCDTCADGFRAWLAARYGDLDALNAAWGAAFWSQRYGDWAEITPPRNAPGPVNPALQLDYTRFVNDIHLANFRRERDILRRWAPDTPITTNFMLANCKTIDYWQWAGEVDVVANDHYLQAERPDNHIELAMCADLSRSLAGGAPWLLMEHSTSAVNWQPRNLAKRPGELARNSMAHLARGADGLLFFQWRASRYGAEKFHSAMVPHGGADTRVWREVRDLGTTLADLGDLAGSRVSADVAILWDWQSWWAVELEARPSCDLRYRDRIEAYYERLWRAGLTVDFAHPEGDLARYRLVLVPGLYLITPAAAKNLTGYVAGGGTVVVSYFSGIVDGTDTVYPGPYPGALRELLGLRVEEFLPLRSGQAVTVDGGWSADVWAEELHPAGAEPVWRYLDGPAAGLPAVTRHQYGAGTAWYVSTRLAAAGLDAVLACARTDAGLTAADLPDGVELVRRTGAAGSFAIVINHTDREVTVQLCGTERITGARCGPDLAVPAGAVRIVHESPGT